MTELSKIFKHLSRDLFIYFLTGFIFIINLTYLDYLFNCSNTYHYVRSIPYWTIYAIIISYAAGHVIFALMYFLFEYTKLENWLKIKFFPVNDNNDNVIAFQIDYEKEITIFANKIDLHEQFIERHTQLYIMRWNFSAGLMFSGILNIIFESIFHFSLGFTITSIILILTGFFLYILSLKTEKDCLDRINKIENAIRQN
jgi:hypothetical protein